MSTYHGIEISLCTLSTRFHSLGLWRRNVEFDVNRVSEHFQQQIDGLGNSGGYRCIAYTLQMKGLQVPHETVTILVKELDPEGKLKVKDSLPKDISFPRPRLCVACRWIWQNKTIRISCTWLY